MEQFRSLLHIAEDAGCLPLIQQAQQQVYRLMEQQEVKVIVTGMRNTGKTTFINRLVGFEVWEAGRMDDEEKPLRVDFEPTEEDPRYNCLLAANHEWNAKDVVLYELREDDILDGNGLTEEMCDKDIVLFMISALAPFNSDEIRILKALQPLQRQVVISNLQYVRESERQKVLDYIKKLNATLALPEVIVWEDNGQDIGRIVRNLLPAFTELTGLRETHAQSIRQASETRLESFLITAIEENQAQLHTCEETGNREAQAIQKAQADWRTVITNLRTSEQNSIQKAAGDMGREAAVIAASLLKSGSAVGFDAAWQAQLTENMAVQLRGVISPRLEKLNRLMVEDLHRAASNAAFLKLPGYREEDFRALENQMKLTFTVSHAEKPCEGTVQMGFGGNPVSEINAAQNKICPDDEDNRRILLGAGVMIGALIVLPLPLPVFLAGGAAVGAGSLSYLNKQREEKEKVIVHELNRCCRELLSTAETGLRDAASRCYKRAADHMEQCMANITQVVPKPTPYLDRDRKLNNLLSALRKQRI